MKKFLNSIYKKSLIGILDSRLYNWMAIHILPYIRFTTYYTSFRGGKYHRGYVKMQPGDIIGAIDSKKLTGAIIPKVTGGILCHSALCIDKRDPVETEKGWGKILPDPGHGDGLEVVEITHLNFTYSDFYDVCKESERVIIFRCLDWDKPYIDRVIDAALSFRKAGYDASFFLGIISLYCSELVYQADRKAAFNLAYPEADYEKDRDKYPEIPGRLQCNIEDLAGLGREYISPDGLLCSKNIIVIWDSANEFTGMTGPEVREKIFKKVG